MCLYMYVWLYSVLTTAHSEEASTRPDLSLLLHQLLLLRSKLLHFVNSVYQYLMTRVSGSLVPRPSILSAILTFDSFNESKVGIVTREEPGDEAR